MNVATRTAVQTLLAADPTVRAEHISLALEVAAGRDPMSSGQPVQQEYLTTRESCDLCRCSRMTIFRLERDGEIRSCRVRGKKLFDRGELIKVLKRGKSRK